MYGITTTTIDAPSSVITPSAPPATPGVVEIKSKCARPVWLCHGVQDQYNRSLRNETEHTHK